jgi:uncharacterized protein YndB with AHSA1/START domain
MADVVTVRELKFERLLDAPIEKVWSYLTDPALRLKWFMGGPIEPHAGGRIGFGFTHAALSDEDAPPPERFAGNVGKTWSEEITVWEPPHRLAFTWDNGAAGTILIELFDDGGRTRLVLTHAGLRGPEDARSFGGGWHAHLETLTRRLRGEAVPDFWAIHRQSEAHIVAALEAQI